MLRRRQRELLCVRLCLMTAGDYSQLAEHQRLPLARALRRLEQAAAQADADAPAPQPWEQAVELVHAGDAAELADMLAAHAGDRALAGSFPPVYILRLKKKKKFAVFLSFLFLSLSLPAAARVSRGRGALRAAVGRARDTAGTARE